MANVRQCLNALYGAFDGYPRPFDPWVCSQCEPGLTSESLAGIPLRSLSFRHLAAVHVMSLDDDALRHYAPRLLELLLLTPAPVFDFRLSELKDRVAGWTDAERSAVVGFGEAVWQGLLNRHPAELGYFSDCPSAIDLLDWCGLALPERLDRLHSGPAAALHLADLVDAVFTTASPFETASKAVVLAWLESPDVGERLQEAFFRATGEAAQRLSTAHELWTICVRP